MIKFLSASIITGSVLLVGCSSLLIPDVVFSKTGDFNSKPRMENCEFNIYTTYPNKKFEEVGVIELINQPARLPRTIASVKLYAKEQVCKNGGNGLLVHDVNGYGGYTKGTVIYIETGA